MTDADALEVTIDAEGRGETLEALEAVLGDAPKTAEEPEEATPQAPPEAFCEKEAKKDEKEPSHGENRGSCARPDGQASNQDGSQPEVSPEEGKEPEARIEEEKKEPESAQLFFTRERSQEAIEGAIKGNIKVHLLLPHLE
jgi:hypothetical protein